MLTEGGPGTDPARIMSADVAALRESFKGPLLLPGEPGYDDARALWNGSIDRRPSLIARCTGTADVIAAVRFAGRRNLRVSIRGGGHNVAGTAVCDGGLMIDLSPMKGVRVDPRTGTAVVQPGVLLGELDHETQPFGLAASSGIVTHTGVAGLTLGGGIGWLMRKHGLACDNMLAADVVTATGDLIRATEDENGDLLWGLRGGGGNYGVVTSFEFRLHPVGPTVVAGPVVYAAEDAERVLRSYRDWIENAPDELGTILNLRIAPPAPWLPPEVHGRRVVIVAVCYVGDPAEGERAVSPARRFASPLADLVSPRPYVVNQGFFDASVPQGWRYYWKSHYVERLSDPVIEALVDRGWGMEHPQSYTIIFHMGGRVREMADDDTAFSGRDSLHAINVNGVSVEPTGDEDLEWVRGVWAALAPHAAGVYMNFLGDEGQDRVRAAYGDAKYARLVALKDRFDPANFFRLNQNIPPSGSPGGNGQGERR